MVDGDTTMEGAGTTNNAWKNCRFSRQHYFVTFVIAAACLIRQSGFFRRKGLHPISVTAAVRVEGSPNTIVGEDGGKSELGTNPLWIDVIAVARNRGLTTPDAVKLLQVIANQNFDFFKKDKDFLVFEHILKSGGTSLSDILLNVTGEAGILPGSMRSNKFNKREFHEALTINDGNGIAMKEWWNSKQVMYSHSNLQRSRHPTDEKETSTFTGWFKAQLPPKYSRKIKIMTFLRDPLMLIASNQNHWMCHIVQEREQLKLRLEQWHNEGCNSDPSKLPCLGLNGTILDDAKLWQKVNSSVGDPCMGLTNLTKIYDDWIEHRFKPDCAAMRINGSRTTKARCKAYMEAGELPKPECRSPQHLMNHPRMSTMMHNLYQHLLLNAPATSTASDYEDYALRHLGGVTTPTRLQEFDMWWFGVTERMHESMCLLHYQLQIPFVETPMERVMPCRPLSAWSEADKALVVEREVRGYSLLRAANAILDVRVAKMCHALGNDEKAASLLPSSCCT